MNEICVDRRNASKSVKVKDKRYSAADYPDNDQKRNIPKGKLTENTHFTRKKKTGRQNCCHTPVFQNIENLRINPFHNNKLIVKYRKTGNHCRKKRKY